MVFDDYKVLSWLIYLLSAALVLLVTFIVVRRWTAWLSGGIMVTAGVLFFTPWYLQGVTGNMAPAVIITFFDIVSDNQGSGWMRAGIPLLTALILAWILLAIGLRVRSAQRLQQSERDEATEPRMTS